MITIILLGTGGATPYSTRTTPMLAVTSADRSILIDCGSGATQRIAQAGLKCNAVDHLCFTHFHADHCVDFPIFVLTSYLGGRDEPLSVLGPPGTRAFVDTMLQQLFPYIPQLVSAITGTDFHIHVQELNPGRQLQLNGLLLRTAAAKHGAPALAYRVENRTESVTVSGDTEFSTDIIDLAENTSVLIHECPFPPHMGSIPGHTSPREVGQVAARARAKNLVLTHIFEEVVGYEREVQQSISAAFGGNTVFGQDLMRIVVQGEEVRFQ